MCWDEGAGFDGRKIDHYCMCRRVLSQVGNPVVGAICCKRTPPPRYQVPKTVGIPRYTLEGAGSHATGRDLYSRPTPGFTLFQTIRDWTDNALIDSKRKLMMSVNQILY